MSLLKILFYLCIFSLALGQFASLSKSTAGGIYIFDILIIVFGISGFFYFLIKNKTFGIPKELLLFSLFIVIAGLSLLPRFLELDTTDFITSLFYLVRFSSYVLAASVVYNMVRAELLSIKEIIVAFGIAGLFVAISGFIQLVVLPDFTVLDETLGWDPHKNRLASTFFDPNFVGGYFALNVALLSYTLFNKTKFKLSKQVSLFLWLSVITQTVALFLTFSRSSWAALSIIILIWGLFKKRWLLLVFILAAFLVYFAVPRVQTRLSGTTDPADSAQFRVISWTNAATIAKDNLVLGVGFNTYRFVQQDYGFIDPGQSGGNSGGGTDSSLLLVFATTGLLGIIMFICGLIYPLVRKGANCFFGLTLVLPLLLHSQFVNSLFFPQIMFNWLILYSIYSIFDSEQ